MIDTDECKSSEYLSSRSNEIWEAAIDLAKRHGIRDDDLDRVAKLTVLDEALEIANKQKEESLKRQLIIPRRHGKAAIKVWDIYGGIARGLLTFKEIGDVLVQIDPIHSAAPWALVRSILTIASAQYEKQCLILSQLEKVATLISTMRIFEKEYLGLGQQSEAEIAVKAALVRLYSVVLRFLVKAKEYFGIAQSRADRFTQAISKRLRVFDKDMDDIVSLLQSEQVNVYTAATLLGRQSQNSISLNMKQWTKEISQLQHTLKVIRNEDDKDRNIRILEWMSTQRHAQHHDDVRLGRLEASGTWLINGTQFGDWAEAEASTILWLHGNPGVGKTKLVSKVVDELPERLKGRVAYFYCSRAAGKQRRNTAVEVFRSLARQLSIEAWPVISDTLGDLYAALEEEDPSRPRHPGMKEAIQVIYDVLAETPATLILDALDECVEDSRHLILDALFEMVDQFPTRIKVFVSSRNYRAIAERLMDGQRPVLHVNVGAQEQTEDINRFIRHRVEQGSLTKFFAIHLTPTLQREIISTLQDRAHGMFLWAKLQLDQLAKARNSEALRRRLRNLSSTELSDFYAEMYHEIEQYKEDDDVTAYDIATTALTWLRCQARVLSPMEFVSAVNPAFPDFEAAKDEIIDVCYSLVDLQSGTGSFRFAHLSIKDFLDQREKTMGGYNSHAIVAKRCLEALVGNYAEQDRDMLWTYAVHHCWYHLSKVNERSAQLQNKLDEFITASEGQTSHLDRWVSEAESSQAQSELHSLLQDLNPPNLRPLLAACVFGSESVIDRLNADSFDSVSDTGKTPLSLAAEYGHDSVVVKMIEKLYKLNINKFTVRASFQLEDLQASRVRLYADALVRLSATTDATAEELTDAERILQRPETLPERVQPATALQASIVSHDLKTAHLLIEKGAQLSLNGGYLGDAVQAAVLAGDLAAVRFLLDRNLEPNCQGGFFGCPLAAAAHFGHQEIVELLIQCGAEATMAGGHYGSVLMAAVHCGKAKITEYLLDCPSFVTDPGLLNRETLFGTPLQRAAAQNHMAIVQTLLDHGAEINAASKLYETVLQPPSRLGHLHMVDYLMTRGASVERVSSRACEALLRQASHHGMRNLVELLLRSGRVKNVDAADRASNNALGYACQRGHKDIISLLVEYGVDFFSKNTAGITALDWCIENDRSDIMGELIRDFIRRNGVRRLPELIEAERPDHSTPLYRSLKGRMETTRTLIDNGSRFVQIVDGVTATPLHAAAFEDQAEVMRTLLQLDSNRRAELGFNIDDRDHIGRTPLHLAAMGDSVQMVELLLENGANPLLTSWDGGWNVFHFSGWRNRTRTIEILLNHFDRNRSTIGDPSALLNQFARDGGPTPLRDVVQQGYLHLVKLFVERGANIAPEIPKDRCHPIFQAVRWNQWHVVRWIVEHAATNFSSQAFETFRAHRDWFQRRTLLHAVVERTDEMTDFLLQHGYDPKSLDEVESVPLHIAAWQGRVKAIKALFEAWPDGCQVKGQKGLRKENSTPREVAVNRGQRRAAELLWQLEGEYF